MKLKKLMALALAGALAVAPVSVFAEEAETEWEYKEAEISISVPNTTPVDGLNAVAELAKEKLGITLNVELRPGAEEGLNIVKTRLAAGEMTDIVAFNSGGVLLQLNPTEYFFDITDEPMVEKLDDTYKGTVTVEDKVYGVPYMSSSSGAVLYNKEVYAELGLEVPHTWDEFMANCEAIKEAGKTAIIGTLADNWTAQVLVLGDFYNVQSAVPTYAEDYENGKVKYAKEGLSSWQKMADTVPYYNEDYVATTYADGCDMLVNGDGAHWIILTQALTEIEALYGDDVNKIGLFGVPGDSADNHGLTTWMPISLYGNKNSEKVEDIKRFMEFYVSDEALNAFAAVQTPDGPYCVKGFELPEAVFDAVKDAQVYFNEGKTSSAIEFSCDVTPVNGGGISAECLTGQTTAEEAANAWDEDCAQKAMQLGFEWE